MNDSRREREGWRQDEEASDGGGGLLAVITYFYYAPPLCLPPHLPWVSLCVRVSRRREDDDDDDDDDDEEAEVEDENDDDDEDGSFAIHRSWSALLSPLFCVLQSAIGLSRPKYVVVNS